MRMRNKPWVAKYLEEFDHDVLIKEPSVYKGKWRSRLNKDIIHVEIGTGKGDYWLRMAKLYPNYGWIGIEKERNCAAIALKKAVVEPIDNRCFIIADASMISEWFADKEIDVIHLNFSDPWPKKRNHKKRLTHDLFIETYDKVLKNDGQIIMKTDNQQLFEFSLLNMQDKWRLNSVFVNFDSVVHQDVVTEYEKKFIDEGKPIYRAVWQKR
ncbi:MAG: tRNA (guanosine(46)-N7)-methyltransferase TrmB [Erysipelotrichaceae bacterium]|nr:tRNA (guanosine(46)-N7)-methyltransferase TrmB [Erysipelotrichaceae bacterium]